MKNSWTEEELKQLSTYIPSSLQTDEDFYDWLLMPEID
jgi:hypothetical protein